MHMLKIKISVILLGVVLIGWAFQERKVASPETGKRDIDLASIERGDKIDNISLAIGGHTALYGLMFYNPAHGEDMNKLGPATHVAYVYYPILSPSHPYQETLKKLAGRFVSQDKISMNDYPPLNALGVLVKTDRYKKFGEIPDGWRSEKSVQGMIINGIETEYNKNTIKKHFPNVNLEKLIIIEENRKPTPLYIVFGAAALGVLLILAGAVWLFAGLNVEV